MGVGATTIGQYLLELNICIIYDQALLHLCMHTVEMQKQVYLQTLIRMFIVTLSVIPQN